MAEGDTIIHYIDDSNYYMIYGVVTLIVVMLLVWYFIRSQLMSDNTYNTHNSYHTHHCEGMDVSSASNASNAPNDTVSNTDSAVDNNVSSDQAAASASTNPDAENTTPEADAAITILLSGRSDAPLDFQYTDKNYKGGPLLKGIYGDVPVYLSNDRDQPYTKNWRVAHAGVYLPNSKTYWQTNESPWQAAYW